MKEKNYKELLSKKANYKERMTPKELEECVSRGFKTAFFENKDKEFDRINKLKLDIIDSIYKSGSEGTFVKEKVYELLDKLEYTHY